MSRLTIALSLALVAGLSIPALAEISRTQLDRRLAAEFGASDTNRDGFLTMPEIERRTARMRLGPRKAGEQQADILAKLWFERADANKDKKISRYEYGRLFYATFSRYDANKDGNISASERAAAERGVRAGPPGR